MVVICCAAAVLVDLALLVVRAAIVADRGECEETELLGAAPQVNGQ